MNLSLGVLYDHFGFCSSYRLRIRDFVNHLCALIKQTNPNGRLAILFLSTFLPPKVAGSLYF